MSKPIQAGCYYDTENVISGIAADKNGGFGICFPKPIGLKELSREDVEREFGVFGRILSVSFAARRIFIAFETYRAAAAAVLHSGKKYSIEAMQVGSGRARYLVTGIGSGQTAAEISTGNDGKPEEPSHNGAE